MRPQKFWAALVMRGCWDYSHRTNGMKLEPHGNKSGIQGVALYPVYCLINHSCYNNTNYVKFPDHHLELRSQLPIKKGEQIFTRFGQTHCPNFFSFFSR